MLDVFTVNCSDYSTFELSNTIPSGLFFLDLTPGPDRMLLSLCVLQVKKMTHAGGRNWWKGGYPPWAQWGNYSHQRGILNFGLSAYALNPWAGTIKYGVPRTFARIRRNLIYWLVRMLVLLESSAQVAPFSSDEGIRVISGSTNAFVFNCSLSAAVAGVLSVTFINDLHAKSLRKAFHAHEEHEVIGTGSSQARQELGSGKRAKAPEY